MIPLSELVERIAEYEDLYNDVSFVQVTTFLETVSRFLPMINLTRPRTRVGLPPLPANVAHVVSMATDLPPFHVTSLWTALGPSLLEGQRLRLAPSDVDLHLAEHGPASKLGRLSLVLSLRVIHQRIFLCRG